MKNNWLKNLLELPGPVWLFGAWALLRFISFALAFPNWAAATGDASLLRTIGCYSLSGLQSLLPLAVLWSMIRRRRFALSLACWYVSIRVIYSLAVMMFPIFSKPGPLLSNIGGDWLFQIVWSFLTIGLWFLFWRFLESDYFNGLFPREERRRIPWWAVVLTAVVYLAGEASRWIL